MVALFLIVVGIVFLTFAALHYVPDHWTAPIERVLTGPTCASCGASATVPTRQHTGQRMWRCEPCAEYVERRADTTPSRRPLALDEALWDREVSS